MKKNVSLLLLALTLVFSLSGCRQASTTPPPPEDNAVIAPVEGTTEADETAAAGEEQLSDSPTDDESEASKESAAADENTLETTVPPTETSVTSATDSEQAQKPQQKPVESAAESTPASKSVSEQVPASTSEVPSEVIPASTPASTSEGQPVSASTAAPTLSGTDLTLRFGGGEEFAIHLYANDTADKIAEYVGTAAWQLPIYHFDDYTGWESFQYYDIPSRYDIPDGSESVTSEKAGAVYYSHPNRIILFYQDANISTEYTPVGYIDFSQALVDAVENNPVVEGWGNKLVFVQP